MNLRISDPKVDELAQKLAEQTGEDPTAAVIRALEEKLRLSKSSVEEPTRKVQAAPLSEEEIEARTEAIREIAERVKKLPILDNRTDDEIVGYNDQGHFD
jgi:antitoxin VapB